MEPSGYDLSEGGEPIAVSAVAVTVCIITVGVIVVVCVTALGLLPVSYTHLDVYKRQINA